jgi:hypothetical protein
MARPQKQSDERRRYRLPSSRATADELAEVRERIRQAGITSSDYIRQAALTAQVKSAQTGKADPLILAELNRIGVNLNQMTKTANATGRVPPELSRLCDKILEIVMRAVEQEHL